MNEMKEDTYSDRLFRQYLLGELSGEERDRIEARYLADEEFFDQLLAVEDDLIDEYNSDELSAGERKQFQLNLLRTARQRERLSHSKVLIESSRRNRTGTRTKVDFVDRVRIWFAEQNQRRVLAFASLVLLTVTILLTVQLWHTRSRLKQLEAERNRIVEEQRQLLAKVSEQAKRESQPNEPVAEVESPNQQKTETKTQVATFTLPLASLRGGGGSSFKLGREITEVHLQAAISESTQKNYQAELQSADGQLLYSLKKLRAQKNASGPVLIIRIPSSVLKVRDYVLRVRVINETGQLEDVGLYSFQITRS